MFRWLNKEAGGGGGGGEQCNALRAEIDNLRENPLLTELGHSWTADTADGGQSNRPDSVSRCCTRLGDEGKEGGTEGRCLIGIITMGSTMAAPPTLL